MISELFNINNKKWRAKLNINKISKSTDQGYERQLWNDTDNFFIIIEYLKKIRSI